MNSLNSLLIPQRKCKVIILIAILILKEKAMIYIKPKKVKGGVQLKKLLINLPKLKLD